MIIKDILSGNFIGRPNRFTVKFKMDNEIELAHLRDPGRLKELLKPNVKLLLRPAVNLSNRKTKYDVLAVFYNERWVLINSGFHSDIAADLIESGVLNDFAEFSIEKREYTYGNSRLDFLLSKSYADENLILKSYADENLILKSYADENSISKSKADNELLLEVKGCTLVEGGLAKFPDAPTLRGKKHVEELIKAKKEGFSAAVLFLILRDDAVIFSPNWDMDQEFANALKTAQETGVKIVAHSFKIIKNREELKIIPFKQVRIRIT